MSGMKPRKDRRFKQWNKAAVQSPPVGKEPNGPAEENAFTYDISLGGARIHTYERFEEGTVLRLQIELVRSHESVSLEGLVKWIKRNDSENVYELGVEFLHSSPQTIMSLMKNLHGEKV